MSNTETLAAFYQLNQQTALDREPALARAGCNCETDAVRADITAYRTSPVNRATAPPGIQASGFAVPCSKTGNCAMPGATCEAGFCRLPDYRTGIERVPELLAGATDVALDVGSDAAITTVARRLSETAGRIMSSLPFEIATGLLSARVANDHRAYYRSAVARVNTSSNKLATLYREFYRYTGNGQQVRAARYIEGDLIEEKGRLKTALDDMANGYAFMERTNSFTKNECPTAVRTLQDHLAGQSRAILALPDRLPSIGR